MKQPYFFSNRKCLVHSSFQYLALTIFILIATFGYGQTVTIGSGTNIGNKLPVAPYFEYSFSEQIIPKAEINTAGTITKIRFYSTGSALTVSNNWTIYLAHTTKTTFTSTTDWILSGAMTQVYSGTISATPLPGWMEITLTTPFNYNNTDNLVVAVDENAPNYTGNAGTNYFRIYTPTPPSPTTNSGIYYNSDTINPDPSSITLAGTRVNYRNLIQFEFSAPCSGTPTGGAVTVSPTSGNPGSTYGVTAAGYTTATGLTYQWQYSDTGGASWTDQGTATSSYMALTGMVAPAIGAVRTWRLQVTCTSSASSANSSTGTFTSTYCTSVSSGNLGRITSFSTVGGITNINNNSGYSAGGYGDFTAQSVSQYLSSSVSFSANLNRINFGVGFGVWVDWNKDGDFDDSGENVYNSNGYLYVDPSAINFSVPATATIGDTRMRIVSNYTSGTPSSCNTTMTNGETEDYTFSIIVPPPPTVTTFPTADCVGTDVVITGTNLANATVKFGTVNATITANTATSITVTVPNSGTTAIIVTTAGGTVSSAPTTFTAYPKPATPPVITSTPSPYCSPVTFTRADPPTGFTYYWQTSPTGTSTADSNPTYVITATGAQTAYLRSQNDVSGCWSDVRSLGRTILAIDGVATNPAPTSGATAVCYAGLGALTILSWTAPPGTGYTYDVYFGTTATPSFVANRNAATYSIPAGTLLPNTTYYWKIVPKNACGDSTGAIVTWSFTTNNAPCYCTPQTLNSPATIYIDDVAFVGTLNDVSNLNSSYSITTPGYQDFTGLAHSVQAQGQGINVTVDAGGNRGHYKAWVDWNKNGVFQEATAELVYDSGFVATASTTFGFVVPLTTVPGDYTIRIRFYNSFHFFWGDEYYAYNFNACEDFYRDGPYDQFGEAEDYTFSVIPSCNAVITNLTDGASCGLPLGGNVNVPLSVGVSAGVTEVRWYSALTGGTLVHTSTISATTSSWTPSIATTTSYYVTAYNGTCESLERTEIVATVNPVANITYSPSAPESCGEDSIVTLTATGDNEIVNLIDEDFETNPISFTTSRTGPNNGTAPNNGSRWLIRTSPFKPSDFVWFPAIQSGFGANRFAMSSSDLGSDGFGNPYVIENAYTSQVKNTNQFLNLTLTFRMYYSRYYDNGTNLPLDFVAIQVATNAGGTNWTDVTRYTSDIGIGTRFASLSLDLSSYINQPNLRIRFLYHGEWCDGVAIDDVKLYGERPLAPSFSWTGVPAVAAYTDAAATIPYVSGTPASTVYIKPTLAQLELGTYNFTATATLTNGCTTSQPITITNKSRVWKGTVDSAWDNPNNWLPYGVPTADNCVIIPNVVKIPNIGIPIPPVGYSAEAKNLTIKNGGSLELLSGNNLTVTDWIHNEGTNNFDIRSDASLLQINDGPNSGAMKMDRILTVKKTDYTYYSSPVDGNNLTTLSSGTPSAVKFKWEPTTNAGGGFVYGNWVSPGSEIMAPGKGYIVRGPSTFAAPQSFTAIFDGTPRNGTITVPITRGNFTGATTTYQGRVVTKDDDNYNLIGNPYPSAIRATSFLGNSQNNNILGSIYLWPHGGVVSAANPDPFYQDFVYNYNSNDYITYNSMGSLPPGTFNGYIGAGQAFFVLMTDAASPFENVYFNNQMRVLNNNTQFLRSAEGQGANQLDPSLTEPQRIYLDLVLPDGKTSSILVGYIDGATNEADRLFDSPVIDISTQNLYSKIGDETMIIQGRPMPLDKNDQVPLGIQIPQQGIYTLAINRIDGIFLEADQDIFIEDKVTGMIHNLKNAPYMFNAMPGRYDDRFILRYTNETLSTREEVADFDFNIIGLKTYIKVTSGNSPIDTISVYDVLGRTLIEFKNINEMDYKIPLDKLNEGTLIVKATLENGKQKTSKIVH